MTKKKKAAKPVKIEDIDNSFLMSEDMRQRRATAFAAAYVRELALNRTKKEALQVAFGTIGLYGNTAQSEQWLKDPLVIKEIKEMVEKAAKKYKRDVEDVLEEVALVAYSDVGEFFERDRLDPENKTPRDGLLLKHLHDMGKERRAIKCIKHKHRIIRHKGSDEIEEINEYEYEVWDKMNALRILSEFHKIINAPRVDEVPGGSNVYVVLPDNGFGGPTPVRLKPQGEVIIPELPAPKENPLDGYEEI